jgi:hypothetical protein
MTAESPVSNRRRLGERFLVAKFLARTGVQAALPGWRRELGFRVLMKLIQYCWILAATGALTPPEP